MKVTVLLVVTVTPARSFLPGRPGLFPWMKLHTRLAVSRVPETACGHGKTELQHT